MLRTWALAAALALALLVAACGSDDEPARPAEAGRRSQPGDGKPPVRLGTKNFTEQFVLGELYAQALRAKGWTVVLKADIGSTEVTDKALENGVIDLYPEYTGTALSVVKGDTAVPDTAEKTYEAAKAFYEARGQTVLEPTPFEDRDAIAVTKAFSRENGGLRSTGDLRRLGDEVVLGAAPEFRTRFAGLVGLRAAYGLEEMRFRPLLIDEIYPALDAGRVQAGDVFTTDPQLASGDYVVLRDPKGIFGFQNVVPVVRQEVLEEQGDGFAEVLDAVSGELTNEVMQRLNAAVVNDERDPADVAREFLRSRELL